MKVNKINENEKINEEVKLDVRKRYFDEYSDESDLELTSTKEKDMMRSMLDDWMCYVRLVRRKLIQVKVERMKVILIVEYLKIVWVNIMW